MTAGEQQYRKRVRAKRRAEIACVLLAVILLLTTVAGFGLKRLDYFRPTQDQFHGIEKIHEKRSFPAEIKASRIQSVANAASLKDFLKKWSQDGGEKMKAEGVHNILLLGIDSDSKLSDSMILLSVNERTQDIHLVSFYRDSYTYLPTDKKNARNRFAKLNAAYAFGGAKYTVRTIEDDYKIKIDNYVLVDYQTFPKVIDALGGVTVNVTKKEAKYLNRTWKKWTRTHKKIQFKAGKMKMDGEHALMFCRVRKLDSDVGRTDRQRRVMSAILNKVRTADLEELNRLAEVLQPDLKTDITEKKRDALIVKAWKYDWQDYKVEKLSMPDEKTRKEGYAGDQWIWIVDYERAAHTLQNTLYGSSNIDLQKDRSDPLKM